MTSFVVLTIHLCSVLCGLLMIFFLLGNIIRSVCTRATEQDYILFPNMVKKQVAIHFACDIV